MRIAFIHDWKPDLRQIIGWDDGLTMALKRLMDMGHEVRYFSVADKSSELQGVRFPLSFFQASVENPEFSSYLVDAVAMWKPDVILCWADCTRPHAQELFKLGVPMALCFAGGDPFGPTWQYFSHFFVESQSYFDRFKERQMPVSTAFGTNEELFKPIPDQPKAFETIYPATFCNWKRQELYARATGATGMHSIAVGFMYLDHEVYCYECCRQLGVATLPHVDANTLRHLYAASRRCVVTAHTTGGSQRTVLEAMAMNLPVIVMSDSDKTREYVDDAASMGLWVGDVVDPDPELIRQKVMEQGLKESHGREYVMRKWSSTHYAVALETGLKSLL